MRSTKTIAWATSTILTVALLTLAAKARAQSDADRENAQALYKAGNDARDAGDPRAAASDYRMAYTLVQTPVIALALGKAEITVGHLIEARQILLAVERIAAKPHESTLTLSARASAKELAATIEARIPAVTLKIAIPAGAASPSVTIDGEPIPALALTAPWKIDPGPHSVVATVANARAETRFDVAEGTTRDVVVEYPEPTAALPIVSPEPAEVATTPKPPPPASPPRSLRPFAYASLALGGAGVGVATVFGVLALNDRSSLRSACGSDTSGCPPSSQSQINALHTHSVVSDVGLGVAIAGLGAGSVLLLVSRGRAHSGKLARLELAGGVGALWINGEFW